MKRLRNVLWIIVSLLAGREITRFILSIDAPSPRLDAMLEWLISCFSSEAANNPDIVFTTGALLTMLLSTGMSMAVIYLLWQLGVRRRWLRSGP
ncbi:hypothetical protein [Frateuria aurantia]|uniref:Uncharacterized protein n=1 Tax=Frateuria aurantia (strain ATCC 33424 / DSM 6220 / KCTC 2777 / LMG 1558 / NBRC 3245 / NCIMB 13370) TaxID=767434 RepID=H8L5D8_FRAAD|nr:hypothetical protein [Frateuria aurantia]AFC85095.1 hypothetical protein Fraau_0616 [Frateuria aurantia DSM 6220]